MENAYQWVPFYEALADKLLAYSNKRSELFELIKKGYLRATADEIFAF